MNHIYLDHNSTTPVAPRVMDAMRPYFDVTFGNASSLHGPGQKARMAVDNARRTMAALLGCQSGEIIFTSGGTEADNMALAGVARAHGFRGHMVVSAIEHKATLETADMLEEMGMRISRVPAGIGPLNLGQAESSNAASRQPAGGSGVRTGAASTGFFRRPQPTLRLPRDVKAESRSTSSPMDPLVRTNRNSTTSSHFGVCTSANRSANSLRLTAQICIAPASVGHRHFHPIKIPATPDRNQTDSQDTEEK